MPCLEQLLSHPLDEFLKAEGMKERAWCSNLHPFYDNGGATMGLRIPSRQGPTHCQAVGDYDFSISNAFWWFF